MLGGGLLGLYGLSRLDGTGAILALLGGGLLYRGASGHSYFYQALGVNTTDHTSTTRKAIPNKKGLRVRRAMTIRQSPEEVYDYWHDVEKAPLYMQGIVSVTKTGSRTSRWEAKDPLGKTRKWNAEFIEEQPAKMLAWHTHGKPLGANAGHLYIESAPDGRGSVVTIELDYFRSGSSLFSKISQAVGALAEYETLETLRRFKEYMEAGEVATTKGQPTGKGRK